MKYTILNSENDEKIFEFDNDRIISTAAINGAVVSVIAESGEKDNFLCIVGNKESEVQVSSALGAMNLKIQKGLILESAGTGTHKVKVVKSSMPGKILKLLCKTGDVVESAQPIIIIEAMKMENEIKSPMAGKVTKVSVNQDQKIETGEILITIEAD